MNRESDTNQLRHIIGAFIIVLFHSRKVKVLPFNRLDSFIGSLKQCNRVD